MFPASFELLTARRGSQSKPPRGRRRLRRARPRGVRGPSDGLRHCRQRFDSTGGELPGSDPRT
eukprot:3105172-Pyramimonas_sp.AAC.1